MATQTQDPKPAGGMALPGVSNSQETMVALRDSLAKYVTQQEVDKLLGDSKPNHEAKNSSLADALSVARDQEWHNMEMNNESELHKFKLATETAKLAGFRRKEEQDTFKMELAKSEAVAKGISVPSQDPKPTSKPLPRTEWQDITTTLLNTPTSPGTLAPSLGASGAQIATTPDTNPMRGAFDALAARRMQLQQQGQIPSSNGTSDADKAHKAILEQLQVQLGKLDEKNLEYGPMGQPGQIMGGLLDVISGPLDIGTMLFGGKPGPMQKAQLLISAANSVSPLVRAGLQDALSRDRMEMTAERFLASRGMGAHSSHLKDAMDFDTARMFEAFTIDMDNLLATDQATNNYFSSESTTGVGDAFRAYQNAVSAMQLIPLATSPEELNSAEQQLKSADAAMKQHFQRFIANGGTLEEFEAAITKAQEITNGKFNKELNYTPGDQKETQFNAFKKSAARARQDELSNFASIVSGQIPIQEEKLKELKLGKAAYETLQEVNKNGLPKIYVQRNNAVHYPNGLFGKAEPVRKPGNKPEMLLANKNVDREYMDPSQKELINPEHYAFLLGEAKGNIGREPNKATNFIKGLYLDKNSAAKLQEEMLRVAKPGNVSTIERIFREDAGLPRDPMKSAFHVAYAQAQEETGTVWSSSGRDAKFRTNMNKALEKYKDKPFYKELVDYAETEIKYLRQSKNISRNPQVSTKDLTLGEAAGNLNWNRKHK